VSVVAGSARIDLRKNGSISGPEKSSVDFIIFDDCGVIGILNRLQIQNMDVYHTLCSVFDIEIDDVKCSYIL
jgi:hypothetical protein